MEHIVREYIGYFIEIAIPVLSYHLYTNWRYHYLSDTGILRVLGFNWKDLQTIRDEINFHYSYKGRRPRPEPTNDYLGKKLHKLVRQGYLDYRIRPGSTENGIAVIKFEYRVPYEPPRKPRRVWQLNPRKLGV